MVAKPRFWLLESCPRGTDAPEWREEQDTQWVTDRAALEAAKGEGVSEVILPGDGGVLLEGLVTNFFVIDKHGTLLTAVSPRPPPIATHSFTQR